MNDFYSPLLALAMIATGCSALIALLRRARFVQRHKPVLRSVAGALSVVGAVALIIAIAMHKTIGHSTGSAAPMDVSQFAVSHPAILVTAIALFVVFGIVFRRI